MLSREVCTIAFGPAAGHPTGERDFISLSPLSEYLTEEYFQMDLQQGETAWKITRPSCLKARWRIFVGMETYFLPSEVDLRPSKTCQPEGGGLPRGVESNFPPRNFVAPGNLF